MEIRETFTREFSTIDLKQNIKEWNNIRLKNINKEDINDDTPVIVALKVLMGKLPKQGIRCPFYDCQKKCKSKSALRNHLRKKHPEKHRINAGSMTLMILNNILIPDDFQP